MQSSENKAETIKIAEYWLKGAITPPSEVKGKLEQLREVQNQIELLQNQKLNIMADIIQKAEEF